MNSGRWFNNAKDSVASSQWNLAPHRVEACAHCNGNNGCDGRDGCNGRDDGNGRDGCNDQDGCDGRNACDRYDGNDSRGVEFNGYMRLWQPNDILTEQVLDEYRGQIGWSGGRVWVNIVSSPSEELVWTPLEKFRSTLASSGWVPVNIGIIRMYSKRFHNRSTGCEPTRSTYSMVFR